MLDFLEEVNQTALLAALVMFAITVFSVFKDPFGTGFSEVPLYMNIMLVVGAPAVTYWIINKKFD